MSRRRWRIFVARVRALVSRGRRDRDFEEEIGHHLDALAAEARARGATEEEARLAALQRFGGVVRARDAYREQRGFSRIEAFWLDLRLAARTLAKRPLLAAAATVSIAMGVGLNVGVHAAVARVLFGTSLSGAAADDHLVAINGEISYPNYQELSRLDAFSGVAALQVATVAWRGGAGMTRVGAKIVSLNFFDVVGIGAARGGTFHDGDDRYAAVLGYGFWQRRFGGDPAVIGRTLTLNGQPYVVIGVLPKDFNAPLAPMVAADVYLPISAQVSAGLADRAAAQFDLTARLRDGVGVGQARAAVLTAAAELQRRYPRENARLATELAVLPAAGLGVWRGVGGAAFPRLLLGAAATIYAVVGLVLLVACANVAGLLLARAEERRREIAICAALGATPWRLAQRFVAESAIIAAFGCMLAGGFYEAATAAVTRVAWTAGAATVTPPGLPLMYCATLALVVTIACAIGPATSVLGTAARGALSAASTDIRGGRARARDALVIAQVAMCFVLLSGASLLFHDVLRMGTIDPGFDTAHTLSVEVRIPPTASGARRRPFGRVRSIVRALPGVESVSAARNLPLMFATWRASVHADTAIDADQRVDIAPVGPRYLDTLRIPMLRGRDLADDDLRLEKGEATPIVVNETLAHRAFGTADPIEQRLVLERPGGPAPDRTLRIVGVVRDSKMRSLDEDPHPVVYLPEIGDFFVVRVAGDAAGALRVVEEAVSTAEPTAWVRARPMRAQVAFAQLPARIGSAALAALGALGLVMAMVGLYAVVNVAASRRTFEIGVRLALGATRGGVLRMILRDGLGVVAVGCAIGGTIAVPLARAASRLVPLNHGRFDPLAFGAVAATMAIVGAAACLVPARRAARVDPVVALRAE